MENKIFKFEADDIKNYIRYEMNLYDRISESFDYVHSMLVKIKCHKVLKPTDVVKLEKLKYNKGKNYNWIAITCGDVKLVLRVYGHHFTFYCKNEMADKAETRPYRRTRYSAFTFYVETEKIADIKKRDYTYEHNFEDLNSIMQDIIKKVAENEVQGLWNSYSLVRPDYCEVENIYYGEEVSSIDKLIFCCEELSSQHLELFAENDMLETLKGLTDVIGKPFGSRRTVKSITTEFPKEYSDPYYHGVGITVADENGKTEFHDVYRLSRWYMEEMENLIKA